ncbi:MAG TPA: sulfite exporter TauE/SafE family protein [Vicinamibacterales bacterium]|jgi:uncharacterized membrane protein YfcA|nr:sulfite exporter TauE/SafE family protein [Vicinamibacterales bacterium]
MPALHPLEWIVAALSAMGLGVAKAGFTGLSLLPVIAFAFLFGARASTGIVLPMLMVGDVGAVSLYRRHARWEYIWRMLPPTCVGIIIGAWLMRWLTEGAFKPIIGWIVLVLTVLQVVRTQRPGWLGAIPHSRAFAWSLGLLAGVTTMLANAAGPVIAIYSLSVGLPKFELVGTNAWLFMIINAFKVPFSLSLGLIHVGSLTFDLMLAPAVIAGVFVGRWLTRLIPQRLFDNVLLAFAAIAALRLIGAF